MCLAFLQGEVLFGRKGAPKIISMKCASPRPQLRVMGKLKGIK